MCCERSNAVIGCCGGGRVRDRLRNTGLQQWKQSGSVDCGRIVRLLRYYITYLFLMSVVCILDHGVMLFHPVWTGWGSII